MLDNYSSTMDAFRDERTSDHPQRKIFGNFSELVPVGVNPTASIAVINPKYGAVDFGLFKVPNFNSFLQQSPFDFPDLLSCWAVGQNYKKNIKIAFVPPETGRAILLDKIQHPVYRDILVKGTGLVKRFTVNNKLRFASRGFDGFLEICEAERDLVNSEILSLAGVLVTAGIGVVNNHHIRHYDSFTAWTGNYVRGFRTQTRISNLFDLDLETRKAAIDDAIFYLQKMLGKKLSYAEYFKHVLEISARNVAIMQAIGFTQDSLHYGQITLAGEVTDLGVGSFKKPKQRGHINTMYPWFRFERQPILMQNIFFKTHAVKAEPEPVRLENSCRAVLEQESLFGAIRSICPESAEEIEAMNPEGVFWNVYNNTYNAFDVDSFKSNVLNHIDFYFNWDAENILKQVPKSEQALVKAKYEELMDLLLEHFENQIETWDRRGPTSIHKQINFCSAVRSIFGYMELDFSKENNGIWQRSCSEFINHNKNVNTYEDLSWKPALIRC